MLGVNLLGDRLYCTEFYVQPSAMVFTLRMILYFLWIFNSDRPGSGACRISFCERGPKFQEQIYDIIVSEEFYVISSNFIMSLLFLDRYTYTCCLRILAN